MYIISWHAIGEKPSHTTFFQGRPLEGVGRRLNISLVYLGSMCTVCWLRPRNSPSPTPIPPHWLNMELYIQCLFGLHVHSCTHLLRPRNPFPPHLGSYTRALLVSHQDLLTYISKNNCTYLGLNAC